VRFVRPSMLSSFNRYPICFISVINHEDHTYFVQEKTRTLVIIATSIFTALCLIFAESRGIISHPQICLIFVLIMAILCPIQGLYYKMNVNNDNVTVLKKNLATYYDIQRFKANVWKHLFLLGGLCAMFLAICLILNNESISILLFISMMFLVLHYSMWFRSKKYLLDLNNRPNIDFFGRLKEKSQ